MYLTPEELQFQITICFTQQHLWENPNNDQRNYSHYSKYYSSERLGETLGFQRRHTFQSGALHFEIVSHLHCEKYHRHRVRSAKIKRFFFHK